MVPVAVFAIFTESFAGVTGCIRHLGGSRLAFSDLPLLLRHGCNGHDTGHDLPCRPSNAAPSRGSRICKPRNDAATSLTNKGKPWGRLSE